MAALGGTGVVITDASVLINLMHTRHVPLLAQVPGRHFVLPDEVASEITRPEQQAQLEQALSAGHLAPVRLDQVPELATYAELRIRFGKGESACLALAQARGWTVACDERGAFLREAGTRLGKGRVINTPGLYVLFIRATLLTIEEADAAKDVLAQKRFAMRFRSFGDLV
jgi:predicted nucleic acid-binding protein